MNLQEAEGKIQELISKHINSFRFRWSNARRRVGCCWYSQRVIEISKPYAKVNDWEVVRETVLHEIAHALAGQKAGHGIEWKNKCIELGIEPRRCVDREHENMPAYLWIGECPHCKQKVYRMRRKRISCGLCDTTFNLDYLIEWRRNEEA